MVSVKLLPMWIDDCTGGGRVASFGISGKRNTDCVTSADSAHARWAKERTSVVRCGSVTGPVYGMPFSAGSEPSNVYASVAPASPCSVIVGAVRYSPAGGE